jgi:hypothetical protein
LKRTRSIERKGKSNLRVLRLPVRIVASTMKKFAINPVWFVVGIAIGVSIGVAGGNLPMGIALGVLIGFLVPMFSRKPKSKVD